MGGDFYNGNGFLLLNVVVGTLSYLSNYVIFSMNSLIFSIYFNFISLNSDIGAIDFVLFNNFLANQTSNSNDSVLLSLIFDIFINNSTSVNNTTTKITMSTCSDIVFGAIIKQLNLSINFSNPLPVEFVQLVSATTLFVSSQFLTFSSLLILGINVFAMLVFISNSLFGEEITADILDSVVGLQVEVEKEFTNLDDIIVALLIFFVCLGYPFLVFTLNSLVTTYKMYGFYGLIPTILFVVILMPLNILYDCGLAFVTFLRGAASSTIFVLEWMYDLLATGIMFVRLLVQHIRFLLMFFALFEIFEFILGIPFLSGPSTNLTFMSNNELLGFDSVVNLLYFLLVNLPIFILNFLYQVGHFLFTVTTHFFAYFALIAWLYLYLYTNFLQEKLEKVFYPKQERTIRVTNNN